MRENELNYSSSLNGELGSAVAVLEQDVGAREQRRRGTVRGCRAGGPRWFREWAEIG